MFVLQIHFFYFNCVFDNFNSNNPDSILLSNMLIGYMLYFIRKNIT